MLGIPQCIFWLIDYDFTQQSCCLHLLNLQGEKDWQKYETARRLKKCVDRIRNQYREDWKSKEMRIRQRAVALYFIDKVTMTAELSYIHDVPRLMFQPALTQLSRCAAAGSESRQWEGGRRDSRHCGLLLVEGWTHQLISRERWSGVCGGVWLPG